MPNKPCPNCGAIVARALDAASQDAHVNYYRCQSCGHIWTTTKDGSAIVRHVTPLRLPPVASTE